MMHPFMDGIQSAFTINIYGTHFVIFYHHFIFNIILYFQYGIIFHWLIIQLSNHCELKCESCGFRSLCLLHCWDVKIPTHSPECVPKAHIVC